MAKLYERGPIPGAVPVAPPTATPLAIAPHALALYQFPGAFSQWFAALDQALTAPDGSELAAGEIPADLVTAFDGMELALSDKLDWAVKIIRTWETQEAAARGEAEAISRLVTTLRAFAAARERRADAMRGLIIRALESARMRSWEGPTWKTWIQANPRSVRWTGEIDVDKLPPELTRVTVMPDLGAAKKVID